VAPTLVVAHSCVLSWWRAVHGVPAPASYARYREQVALGLRGADCVVAPSRAMLLALQRHYGAPSDGRVLYNGCDLARFSPGPKRPLIAAAGRVWDEAKNLGTLARVASELRWPVCIAGDERAPEGSADGSSFGVETNVRRLGKLASDGVAALLGEAAIFAAPARYEPFGLSVLEAAASGCALVLGDIDSQRELWHDAALFVRPDEPELLAATLNQLTEDAALCSALAARARRRAADFSHARFAAGYTQLYRELVERGRTHVRPLSVAASY
jgi:glycosyltransferase involved in cell wall biosynthesis